MVPLEEHFDFEAEVVVQIISAYPKEIESVLLVHSILGVKALLILDFEEFVVGRVISKLGSLLELESQAFFRGLVNFLTLV